MVLLSMGDSVPTKRKLWTAVVVSAVVLGVIRLGETAGYDGTGVGALFVLFLVVLVVATVGIGVVSVVDRVRS